MNFTSFDDNIFKLQLKARLRVPILLQSKQLKIEYEKNHKQQSEKEIDLNIVSQTKLNNKPYIPSFHKYTLKTNLIKKLLEPMPFKDLYEEEKECSSKCGDVIKEIKFYKDKYKSLNLPSILKNENKLKKRKFIYKKIKKKNILKIEQRPVTHLIFKDNIHSDFSNLTNLSTTKNKFTSYIDSTKEKDKLTSKSQSKIIFNYKNKYTIIKGGGIKYNNSIFRYKNMNDLISNL